MSTGSSSPVSEVDDVYDENLEVAIAIDATQGVANDVVVKKVFESADGKAEVVEAGDGGGDDGDDASGVRGAVEDDDDEEFDWDAETLSTTDRVRVAIRSVSTEDEPALPTPASPAKVGSAAEAFSPRVAEKGTKHGDYGLTAKSVKKVHRDALLILGHVSDCIENKDIGKRMGNAILDAAERVDAIAKMVFIFCHVKPHRKGWVSKGGNQPLGKGKRATIVSLVEHLNGLIDALNEIIICAQHVRINVRKAHAEIEILKEAHDETESDLSEKTARIADLEKMIDRLRASRYAELDANAGVVQDDVLHIIEHVEVEGGDDEDDDEGGDEGGASGDGGFPADPATG